MRVQRVVQMLVFVLIVGIIVVLGFGQAVLHLWNWLMPAAFGLHPITYWQALGLLGLSWLLFGGPRAWFGGHRGYWRHRMRERWDAMTPEERERFREGMRARCGHSRTPAADSKV
jgi:Ca2+/H+ antiporter, TMEM165/GDT1 family